MTDCSHTSLTRLYIKCIEQGLARLTNVEDIHGSKTDYGFRALRFPANSWSNADNNDMCQPTSPPTAWPCKFAAPAEDHAVAAMTAEPPAGDAAKGMHDPAIGVSTADGGSACMDASCQNVADIALRTAGSSLPASGSDTAFTASADEPLEAQHAVTVPTTSCPPVQSASPAPSTESLDMRDTEQLPNTPNASPCAEAGAQPPLHTHNCCQCEATATVDSSTSQSSQTAPPELESCVASSTSCPPQHVGPPPAREGRRRRHRAARGPPNNNPAARAAWAAALAANY